MLLGIDIGGTTVKLGIVDEAFCVVESTAIPTGAERISDEIINDIVHAAQPLCEQYAPRAVGIGSPGRVDPEAGLVLRAGHLPFQNEPLRDKIGNALGLPAFLDNDANCALLAEATAGTCKDCRDALMVTLGTGIGGAILIDRQLYRGHNFRAGELGHFILDHKGAPCPCGLHGCFEQYASATALCSMASKAALAAPDSLLTQTTANGMNGKAVFAAANDGCETANAVLDTYGEYLAMGLNSMVKIFMPQCIVLAGGIAKAGDALLERIAPLLLPEADIRLSILGGNAGVIGAAILGCPEAHFSS